MKIAVSTANLYFRPFRETLEMIAEAGFSAIELTLYWKGGDWEMAQHLKDLSAHTAMQMVHDVGLDIAALHDIGGVVDQTTDPPAQILAATLEPYLAAMSSPPRHLILHVPHRHGLTDAAWWNAYREGYAELLAQYHRSMCVSLENLPAFPGYDMPLHPLVALRDFVDDYQFGVTLDTTHCAEDDIALTEAVALLGKAVTTLHLSDFAHGQSHVFFGDGELKWSELFHALPSAMPNISLMTLECDLCRGKPAHEVTHQEFVTHLQIAKARLERSLANGHPAA